jgi:hypothetical protein
MTTYAEKLKSPEWENFRLEIIKAKYWNCENCQNKKIKKQYKKGKLIGLSEYKYSKLAQEEGLLCFIIKFVKGHFAFDAFYWTRDESFLQNYISNRGCKVFYESIQESDGKTHNRIIAFKKGDEWIYVNDMHVHHTYYQEGLNPWEYPKECLQTLCWDCHEKLHENSYIPHLDKNGKEIGKFKNCNRCYGAGYLPEYFYHKRGICFECDGLRYTMIK